MIKGGYYIKARKIQESEIAHSPPHVREIWDWLLKEANHSEQTSHGTIIKRGQCVRTYDDIREGLHWMVGWRKMKYSKWDCEKAMKVLKKATMITTQKTTRGLFITICNYNTYQNPKNYENHTIQTTKATRKPQTTDTINKNDKNVKNDKNKEKYIKRKNIPTKQELVDYAKEKKIPLSIAGECFYYYDKIGWVVGKNLTPMTNWKSALSGWWLREKKKRKSGIVEDTGRYSRTNYGEGNVKSLGDIFKSLK